ncbi:MAG: T9SS type A sorting domain-containing protein, partial [bacterium]
SQAFGDDQREDTGWSVIQASDGGFIVTGKSYSRNYWHPDAFLIKVDDSGNLIWSKFYGRSEGSDLGSCLLLTSDGGIIFTGTADSGPQSSAFLLKTDDYGNEQWFQNYDQSTWNIGHCVQQTSDGGYIIAGETYTNYPRLDQYLVKTDSSGNMEWSSTFGDSDEEHCEYVLQTADGGYIIVGSTSSYSSNVYDIFLVRTDINGNLEWWETYGDNSYNFGKCIQQLNDGGFIVAGYKGWGGSEGVFLIRLAPEEDLIDLELVPVFPNIQIPAGGGEFDYWILASNNTLTSMEIDSWIYCSDARGVELDHFIGPRSKLLEPGQSQFLVTQLVDGSFSPGIYTYVLNIGEFPGTVWASGSLNFEKLDNLCSDNYPVDGAPNPFDEITSNQPLATNHWLATAHPNPFNPYTTISFDLPVASQVTLNVFDIHGRRVGIGLAASGAYGAPTRRYNPGQHSITFDGSNLTSGIYLYRLEAGEYSAVGKMVLLK